MAYNNFSPFNPYQNPYQYNPQFAQGNIMQSPQNANILPPQQVLQAAGKSSIDALQMSPNSSVIIMDSTAPMVWLCTSDGLGKVSATAYDIVLHKDKPAVDMGSLEERVTNIETIIARMGGNHNEQSNDGNAQSGQNARTAGKRPANKADDE